MEEWIKVFQFASLFSSVYFGLKISIEDWKTTWVNETDFGVILFFNLFCSFAISLISNIATPSLFTLIVPWLFFELFIYLKKTKNKLPEGDFLAIVAFLSAFGPWFGIGDGQTSILTIKFFFLVGVLSLPYWIILKKMKKEIEGGIPYIPLIYSAFLLSFA